MRAWHLALGFAIFTALAVFFALRSAKSTPPWLIVGAIVLGALIVAKVSVTILSMEKKRELSAKGFAQRKRKGKPR